ncbi:hypothetical protein VB713_21125 [Anabaena cylindrica UHCC 0172]|uniref:hypothetical protein n=1 Tax=Anabaena cylindrica TaxID=1165 RepID=UPI002B1F2F88|nr:hypothetical protein [Anabaena cylindrica]MEA5553444.1 hypothetical protein [Anabaena cylindrica UHCC 0172]
MLPCRDTAIALLIPKSDRLSFIKVILPEWDRFSDLRKAIPAERFAIAPLIHQAVFYRKAIATS